MSDALTEVIYDQSADIIDYDNPTKIYINDSTAEVESDQFSAKETSDDADVVSSTVQNLVVYSSTPNTEGFTAKKSAFGYPPDFEDIEASEEVCFVKSDDPDAFDHPVTVEEDEPEPEPEPEPEVVIDESAQSDSSGAGVSQKKSKRSGDKSKKKKKADPGDDDSQDDAEGSGAGNGDDDGSSKEPLETDDSGGNDNGDVQVAYDATDPTQEPAKVESIAAFGPAATIVQMVGGAGALAATDAETLSSSSNFSRVFDTSGVKLGWSDDGTDASSMDVQAVIDSGAATVLVYAGDYFKNGLSDADIKALNKAGVTQTVIYPMTTSSNIKMDVSTVGDILSESTKVQYSGQTQKRASEYKEFHDRVVSAAASSNGAGGLVGKDVYQAGNDSAAPAPSGAGAYTYTLLIDEYENASYTGSTVNGWKPKGGLAFASAGYNSTPVSYYIQAGGLVNNAAANTGKSDSGAIVAWQFSTNNFPYRKGEWSGDVAGQAKTPDGYSLLTTPNNLHAIFPFGESFGSASFPKIIVADSDIKSKIISNSADDAGVYHPYGYADGGISMMGPDASLPACIGFNGSDSSQTENLFEEGAIDADSIVVNPRGLFSDWTQGTVESFLEAAWVNDVANVNAASQVGWQQEVADFYEKFYGYTLNSSDWQYMNPEGL